MTSSACSPITRPRPAGAAPPESPGQPSAIAWPRKGCPPSAFLLRGLVLARRLSAFSPPRWGVHTNSHWGNKNFCNRSEVRKVNSGLFQRKALLLSVTLFAAIICAALLNSRYQRAKVREIRLAEFNILQQAKILQKLDQLEALAKSSDARPSVPAVPESVPEAEDIDLACLTSGDIENVRKTRSMEIAFEKCREELASDLGKAFADYGDNALKAILATAISARFALYGPSNALSCEHIAAETHLNCGNTIYLAGFLLGQSNRMIRPIGFDGGAVGNHAQLLYLEDNDPDVANDILLDPTVGLVAITSLNNLLKGTPVTTDRIKRFIIKDKSIEDFRSRVYNAIYLGLYRPSDFMFLHDSVSSMYKSADVSKYFTPAGIYFREKMDLDGIK